MAVFGGITLLSASGEHREGKGGAGGTRSYPTSTDPSIAEGGGVVRPALGEAGLAIGGNASGTAVRQPHVRRQHSGQAARDRK